MPILYHSTIMDSEKAATRVEVTEEPCSESRSDSGSSSQVIDQEAEKRLTRKLDFQLLPVCYVLCLIIFLDKINIGNARIQGLEKELKMNPKSNQFNIALTVFWITYILGEVPSNIILKNSNPSTSLSVVIVLFGRYIHVMSSQAILNDLQVSYVCVKVLSRTSRG
jgi:hypothetical protein